MRKSEPAGTYTPCPCEENHCSRKLHPGTLELSGVNLMYEGTRVKSWLVGRDLNPAGRGDGSHYALGAFSVQLLRPIPTATPIVGFGNSINNDCPPCERQGYHKEGGSCCKDTSDAADKCFDDCKQGCMASIAQRCDPTPFIDGILRGKSSREIRESTALSMAYCAKLAAGVACREKPGNQGPICCPPFSDWACCYDYCTGFGGAGGSGGDGTMGVGGGGFSGGGSGFIPPDGEGPMQGGGGGGDRRIKRTPGSEECLKAWKNAIDQVCKCISSIDTEDDSYDKSIIDEILKGCEKRLKYFAWDSHEHCSQGEPAFIAIATIRASCNFHVCCKNINKEPFSIYAIEAEGASVECYQMMVAAAKLYQCGVPDRLGLAFKDKQLLYNLMKMVGDVCCLECKITYKGEGFYDEG